ncbi:hypothetical protein KAR91_22945 [Candidatus Pacearchaeota archaeon]|nr:hypothetical protein [Candidatus Pacearchaeota archaeon]
MEPVDPKRCQADKPTGHNFMTLGPGKPRERCKNKAVMIATENKPSEDGKIGFMSLCKDCLEVLKAQMSGDYAHFIDVEIWMERNPDHIPPFKLPKEIIGPGVMNSRPKELMSTIKTIPLLNKSSESDKDLCELSHLEITIMFTSAIEDLGIDSIVELKGDLSRILQNVANQAYNHGIKISTT